MDAVARELEIIESVLVTSEQMSAKGEDRRRKRPPSELLVNLLQVVQVNVAVARGPDEVADIKCAVIGDQVGEKRVAREV